MTTFARHIWQLYEPLHAVTYFAAEARAAFEEAGLRGFWRGYFAGRAAPLGAVTAAPVTALFFSFAPGMVTRALPDVWQRATPDRALTARLDGAVATLRTVLPPDPARWTEAAGLLEEAAGAAVTDGRPLAAANAALPRPADPPARLWQAATVLREHRGDGHITALVDAGLTGCQALALRDALHGGRDRMQPARGWTDTEWDAAVQALAERGWLDTDGRPTATGAAAHATIEERTDRLAAHPWTALSDTAQARLSDLLTPLATAAEAVVPYPNPIGLPRPTETPGRAGGSLESGPWWSGCGSNSTPAPSTTAPMGRRTSRAPGLRDAIHDRGGSRKHPRTPPGAGRPQQGVLGRHPGAWHVMTGVRAAHRGTGLSPAWKPLAIRFVRAAGYARVVAFHHPRNHAAV